MKGDQIKDLEKVLNTANVTSLGEKGCTSAEKPFFKISILQTHINKLPKALFLFQLSQPGNSQAFFILGDCIQAILPTKFKDKFKGRIVENTTFTLQNFEVEKNDMTIKATDHQFKLVFNGGTSVDNIDKHDIPKPSFSFKEFDEIKKGVVRSYVLIDKM